MKVKLIRHTKYRQACLGDLEPGQAFILKCDGSFIPIFIKNLLSDRPPFIRMTRLDNGAIIYKSIHAIVYLLLYDTVKFRPISISD